MLLKTMFAHHQAVDYPFLLHELPKIGVIALVTGLLNVPLNRRGWLLHSAFGVMIGFIFAVIAVKLGIAELMT
jgi:hypothetical protein